MLTVVEHLVILNVLDDLLNLCHEESIVLFEVTSERHKLFSEVLELSVCSANLRHQVLNVALVLLEEGVQSLVLGDSLRFLNRLRKCESLRMNANLPRLQSGK